MKYRAIDYKSLFKTKLCINTFENMLTNTHFMTSE